MNTSAAELRSAIAVVVEASDDTLSVDLVDGRTVCVPLAWYPRLLHASRRERENWRLIGNGVGIHWPDLDEDVSVEHLLLGIPSQESQTSLKRWLEQRSVSSAAATA